MNSLITNSYDLEYWRLSMFFFQMLLAVCKAYILCKDSLLINIIQAFFLWEKKYLPQYMLMISDEAIYIDVCISLSTIFKEEVMKVYLNGKK